MAERLKNTNLEHIRIQIPEEVLQSAREQTLQNGTFYIVPLSKYERYDNGGPKQISVSQEQVKYFKEYLFDSGLGTPSIGADLENILPFVTSAAEIGLDPEHRQQVEEGLTNLVSIPQQALQSDEFRNMFFSSLTDRDKERLEVDAYNPAVDYLHPGVLLRADLLLKEDGKPLSCDPNLMPLGYSIMHELSQHVEEQTQIPVAPTTDYFDAIKAGAQRYPNQISGIVTGLNYPNWLSHMTQAKMIRDSGVPFYVIPTETLNEDGTLDIDALNEFNRVFGIEEVSSEDPVPGLVVRYSRETKIFQPGTEVVNAPGIRLLETQIWPGLMTLPGFEEFAQKQGITKKEIDSALSVAIPTLVLKSDGETINVATALLETNDGYDLRWENLEERPDILLATLWMNGANNPSEKPNELSWYLKTLSTSGNKGTAFTNDGRIDQTVKNVRGRVQKFGFNHGGLFLLQPKVRSILPAEDGEEARVKIDHFISMATGKTVSIDYMSTPKKQRAAHGGSSTRIGLVKL